MYVYTYLGWRKITNKYDGQTSIGLLIVKYEEGWMSYISRVASLKSYILTYFIGHISIEKPEAKQKFYHRRKYDSITIEL